MLKTIENRLENWGHVMGRSRGGAARCASAEGNYIRERGTYDLEERRLPRSIADPVDARRVEEAWAKMPNAPQAERRLKNLLRLWYVRRCPYDFICRRQGIPPDFQAFNEQLARAQAAIASILSGMREAA